MKKILHPRQLHNAIVENKESVNHRNVMFLDETWIFKDGIKKFSWQDDTSDSVPLSMLYKRVACTLELLEFWILL